MAKSTKKKVRRSVTRGVAHIKATFNNTMITITDTAGETRSSSSSVTLGYAAMEARLSVASWLTVAEPVRVTVATSTLNGQPLGAAGTLEVFRLKGPSRPVSAPFDASSAARYGPPNEPSP